jgi:hypothetical protein
MASTTLAPWLGRIPESLNLPESTTFEPSGLTLYEDQHSLWIVAVGDSGKLAQAAIQSDSRAIQWQGPLTFDASSLPLHKRDKALKPTDFECVTWAGGKIMIGVEGDRPTSDFGLTAPKVLCLQQSAGEQHENVGVLTGSSWSLEGIPLDPKGNRGMEALTCLPVGCYPAWWASKPYHGGVFVAATQYEPKGYVFHLENRDAEKDIPSQPVESFSVPRPLASAQESKAPRISEFFFDAERSILWVAYDGGSASDYLQALSWNPATGAIAEIKSRALPWLGVEGMAVSKNDLYFAIDETGGENNGVYVLKECILHFLSND